MSLSLWASENQDSEGIKIVSAISTFVLKDTCTLTFSLHFSAKMHQLRFGLTRYSPQSELIQSLEFLKKSLKFAQQFELEKV